MAKAKKPDDALGVRLQWPETEPTSPIGRPRLRHAAPQAIDPAPSRRRTQRRALPPATETSSPTDAAPTAADDGMAETLDRFAERVAVLTEAVDGLRTQLEQRSRQVETLTSDVSARLDTLQEAAAEVGRVRAVLAARPTEGLERQVSDLIDEVKAARRSVAVSRKKKPFDDDAVERIVRSVVERMTGQASASKTSRSRRSSVAD